MKLSYLLTVLDQLRSFNVDHCRTTLANALEPTKIVVENSGTASLDSINKITEDYLKINQDIDAFADTVNQAIEDIKKQIDIISPQYLTNSFRLYDESIRIETARQTMGRMPKLDDAMRNTLETRLRSYATSWQYPGMILRPGKESWIESLLSLDPLYVVDESSELVDCVDDKFNVHYIARLRKVIIDGSRCTNILQDIPDRQLGLCFLFNYLNFRPMEVIVQLMREISTKLRPGGVLIMTVNDCDRPGAVDLCERNFACYTPLSLILDSARTIGLELLDSIEISTATTWVEFAKPGELSSLRGGQSLAKIIAQA